MDYPIQRHAQRGLALILLIVAGCDIIFNVGLGIFLWTRVPNDSRPALVLIILGLVSGLAFLGAAALAYQWRSLFPKSLLVTEGKIQLKNGDTVVGQVPLHNVAGMNVLRSPLPKAINNAAGLGGAMQMQLAQKKYEAGIGLSILLRDAADRDTFWPAAMRTRDYEIQLKTAWQKNYQEIYDVWAFFIPKRPEPSVPAVGFPAPPVRSVPSGTPKPAAPPAPETNPFDFS